MPCPDRACAGESRLFGDNQPFYLDLLACYEAHLVDAGGEANPHLIRATCEGVLSHEATRDIQHLDAIGIHRRCCDGEGPRVGIREDAEGASIRPQAGGYVEVDGVTRRTAGSHSSYRFQDDGVLASADIINSEGVALAGGDRRRIIQWREGVVQVPGVAVNIGGLQGEHIEGHIASFGDGEGLITNGIIVGIGDLGLSDVLHDDGYRFGEEIIITVWVFIGIEDDLGGYIEDSLNVGIKCVCSAGSNRITVGIQPLISRGIRGRRIKRDKARVYAYRPEGSPSEVDGAGSYLVARDGELKFTLISREGSLYHYVESMS